MSRDIVFENGSFITMCPARPRTDCLVVRDGAIVSLDAADAPAGAQRVDLGGRTALPGFVDTHIHLHAFAKRVLGNDLTALENPSIEDIRTYLAGLCAQVEPGKWITVFGYDPYNNQERRLLTRWDIDAASPENPVRMYHRSGHAQLVNSKALEVMGIDIESEDPDGGMIDREVPSGEPNGMLFGMDDYISLFVDEAAQFTMDDAAAAAGKVLASNGVTCVHDATLRNTFERLTTLEDWAARGLLPQRLRSCVGIDEFLVDEDFAQHYEESSCAYGVKFILNQIRGRMNIGQGELDAYFTLLQEAGVPGMIHCVDQEQLEAALHAIEAAVGAFPEKRVPHRIEHASLLTPDMAQRLARLGVTVSSQPTFLYYSGERYLDTVPADEQDQLYCFGTLHASGVPVAFSSDAPISPVAPLHGIYSAVTRKSRKGRHVTQSEGVSVMDALAMHTINGARAVGLGDAVGSLEVGKRADFAVLDRDPLALGDPEELKDVHVTMTVIDGEAVWEQ